MLEHQEGAAVLPRLSDEGTAKVIYNSFLIFASLAGTIITSYRLTFRIYDFDALYWIITAVYLLDIPYTFNQSVKKGLTVHTDRKSIARLYLQGWFAVDAIAALPFTWFFFITTLWNPGRRSEVGAALDIIMITKIMKMVKISKVSAIFTDIRESLTVNPALMRLVTFAFWFVTVVHLMACGWVLIGASEHSRSPFDQYLRGVVLVRDHHRHHRLRGLHPKPRQQSPDHLHASWSWCSASACTATSSATWPPSSPTWTLPGPTTRQRWRRSTISSAPNAFPPSLQARVRNYYAYLWETQKSVATIPITEELPHTLAMEVLLFLNRSILEKVSLFKNANEIFIREIVQLLRPMVFLPDDYIIRQGEYGDCMYFLSNGDVEVVVNGVRVATLGQGSPFGETALIQGEKRMASIRALTYCDVYKLSKTDFDALRAHYPDFDAEVKKVVEARIKDTQEKTQK